MGSAAGGTVGGAVRGAAGAATGGAAGTATGGAARGTAGCLPTGTVARGGGGGLAGCNTEEDGAGFGICRVGLTTGVECAVHGSSTMTISWLSGSSLNPLRIVRMQWVQVSAANLGE